jgi:hypothetical protein
VTLSANKDLPLKFMLKSYLQALGYVCELEVQIADKNYQNQYKREQFSDFDLLALAFEGDFNLRRVAAECKSGDQHALDEVAKLSGILRLTGVERGYFVKTKIHPNARMAARSLSIGCFDEAELNSLLGDWSISQAHIHKVERAIYERRKKYEETLKADFPKLLEYLTYDYWSVENHRNIHNILFLLKSYAGKFKTESPAHRYIQHRALHLFGVALLRMCGDIFRAGITDPGRSLAVELYGGPRARRDREALQDNINKMLVESGKDQVPLDDIWVGPLGELVARLLKNGQYACSIPQVTSAFLENAFYDDKVQAPKGFSGNYHAITIKLVLDMVQFLTKHTGVSEKAFAEMMEL